MQIFRKNKVFLCIAQWIIISKAHRDPFAVIRITRLYYFTRGSTIFYTYIIYSFSVIFFFFFFTLNLIDLILIWTTDRRDPILSAGKLRLDYLFTSLRPKQVNVYTSTFQLCKQNLTFFRNQIVIRLFQRFRKHNVRTHHRYIIMLIHRMDNIFSLC